MEARRRNLLLGLDVQSLNAHVNMDKSPNLVHLVGENKPPTIGWTKTKNNYTSKIKKLDLGAIVAVVLIFHTKETHIGGTNTKMHTNSLEKNPNQKPF
jgi:hypothetical protein